jgi:hypothetical protein
MLVGQYMLGFSTDREWAIRIVLALSIASAVYAADVVVSAVHGTVEKVDPPARPSS